MSAEIKGARSWFSGTGPEDGIVIASRIRLARNCAEFAFPHRLAKQDSIRLLARVDRFFRTLPSETDKSLSAIDVHGASPEQKARLEARSLIPADFGSPVQRLYLSADECCGCLVNQTDHFRLWSMRPGLDLQGRLAELRPLEEGLEAAFPFAVSLEWGYLSPQLSNLGTALSASVLLHLPAIARSLEPEALVDAISGAVDSDGVALQSFRPDSEFERAGIFLLGNTETLGRSEHEVLNKLDEVARVLIHYEREATASRRERDSGEFDDEVWRAWGLLKSCRRIDVSEAFVLLSHLRMGLTAGVLLDGQTALVTGAQLNSLIFLSQEGILGDLTSSLMEYGPCATIEEARATLIRVVLGDRTQTGRN